MEYIISTWLVTGLLLKSKIRLPEHIRTEHLQWEITQQDLAPGPSWIEVQS